MSEPQETRECPYCKEEIKAEAIKCKHCGSGVTPERPGHEGICPFCKEQIHPEATRCKHCKSTLNADKDTDCGCGEGAGFPRELDALTGASGWDLPEPRSSGVLTYISSMTGDWGGFDRWGVDTVGCVGVEVCRWVCAPGPSYPCVRVCRRIVRCGPG